MSGSAVAAGDVRSTCGNCGSALIVERGGVVRLAEPPPGPAAAPQLIVPPAFEPPSHATTMREYASADEVPPHDGQFYVARQAPAGTRDLDALLGEDVRAYVEDGEQSASKPTFAGPAVFGSDARQEQPAMPTPQVLPDFAPPELLQPSGPALTRPTETFVPAEAVHTPINVPYEVPGQGEGEEELVEEVSAELVEAEELAVETVADAPIADDRLPTADSRWPIADDRLPTADSRSPIADSGSPTADDQWSPPDNHPPISAAPLSDDALAEQPLSVADFGIPLSAEPAPAPETFAAMADTSPSAPQPFAQDLEQSSEPAPPALASYESMYAPPERPSALMFANASVAGLAGPAREAEQTRLAPVVRQPEPDSKPGGEQPVLLTEEAPPPETLSLAEMPEWAGDRLEEAQAYVPPFAAPVREDEIDNALSAPAEVAPRPAPTPESYFDASDPLAAAEADMYAGHQVVQPTEMVGDAFTAMVPPVGTQLPHDSVTVNMAMDPATSAAVAEAEDLAVLRASRRRGALWAVGACVLFAFGCVSYAASRGYLDPIIAHATRLMKGEETPVAEQPPVVKPEGEQPPAGANANAQQPSDTPPAEAAKPTEGAELAEAPKPTEAPKAPEATGDTTATALQAGAPTDPNAATNPETATKAGLGTPSAETDDTPPTEAKPAAPPSKAMQACYAKGNRLLNAKKVNLAIRELNKCLDIDPLYGRTYRSLGVAYMLLGRERSAILAYEKFVDYEPEHKDAAKVREIITDYYKRRKN